MHKVPVEARRETHLFVPNSYDISKPTPLVVSLHGAGGDFQNGVSLLRSYAEAEGFLLLAPSSQRQTWDVIVDAFGTDVTVLDAALRSTFERFNLDKSRLAIGGFSDGASYALSLGVTNGDLFTHVLAFSPGFLSAREAHGSPKIYVSHGTGDQVLPIDHCSRRLVPQLKRAKYDVTYKEFEGGHTVPPERKLEAIDLFIRG